MQTNKPLKCMECGTTKKEDEVCHSSVTWTAWGRSAFDFNWRRNKVRLDLCANCEDKAWILCNFCGALVDRSHYGTGYLPDGYQGENICPACAKKKKIKITTED